MTTCDQIALGQHLGTHISSSQTNRLLAITKEDMERYFTDGQKELDESNATDEKED